jgi:hypothetical protein
VIKTCIEQTHLNKCTDEGSPDDDDGVSIILFEKRARCFT